MMTVRAPMNNNGLTTRSALSIVSSPRRQSKRLLQQSSNPCTPTSSNRSRFLDRQDSDCRKAPLQRRVVGESKFTADKTAKVARELQFDEECLSPEECVSSVTAAAAAAAAAAAVAKLNEHRTLLVKLHTALESVLGIFAGRGRLPILDAVRSDVQMFVLRDLKTEWLEQILSLSGGCIEPVWVAGSLHLEHRVEGKSGEMEKRAPSILERQARIKNFEEAADKALSTALKNPQSWVWPSAPLPSRPVVKAPEAPAKLEKSVVTEPAFQMPSAAKPSKPAVSIADRLASLRQRVVKKEGALEQKKQWQEKVDQLSRRINACEDATRLHGIVAHFFARSEFASTSSSSAPPVATEEEVLRMACSSSAGTQCARPLAGQAAETALEFLASTTVDWFKLEDSQYSKSKKRYLKKIVGSSAHTALEMLKAENASLQQKRVALVEAGPAIMDGHQDKLPRGAAGDGVSPAAGSSVATTVTAPKRKLGSSLATTKVPTLDACPEEVNTANLPSPKRRCRLAAKSGQVKYYKV